MYSSLPHYHTQSHTHTLTLSHSDFSLSLQERCHRGEELLRSLERWSNLSSADLQDFEVKVRTFWARLQDFSHRVRTTGHSIERAAQLYRFLDQVGLISSKTSEPLVQLHTHTHTHRGNWAVPQQGFN